MSHTDGYVDSAEAAVMDEWFGTDRENAPQRVVHAEAMRYLAETTVPCTCQD